MSEQYLDQGRALFIPTSTHVKRYYQARESYKKNTILFDSRSLELVMLRFLSVALKLLFVVLLVVVLQLLQQL